MIKKLRGKARKLLREDFFCSYKGPLGSERGKEDDNSTTQSDGLRGRSSEEGVIRQKRVEAFLVLGGKERITKNERSWHDKEESHHETENPRILEETGERYQ